MAGRRFLVFDIETIWDRTLLAQVLGVPPDAGFDALREQVMLKYSGGFPPPLFHIPVCIAMIDVDVGDNQICNATVLESPEEKTLLQQFWKVVQFRKGNNPVRTTLVHFNGRGFDLPVLFYRSLKHRIRVMTLEDRSRFSFESSHDICDDLSDFGASGRPSLDALAKMLGLPGKTDTHGWQVEELYEKGERARIRDYCMDDALSTYYVWLTLRLVRGQISEEKYHQAFDGAAEAVRNCRVKTDGFFTSGQ
ncbi:MAG TPA: ribonuclease H-like domain-containing protein [Acidobacteriota bacterium]|nr:ribonuclease H-like domain-containing protein [Acidobacteriota bacterium]